MHDATSTQHEKESHGLVHQVTIRLDKRKSDITHLVTEVEDLILKDEL